jgi:enolase-phosphatase E1
MIRAIVTDIEGTTSSLSFVKDILFPYAKQKIPEYIHTQSQTPAIQELLTEIREVTNRPDLSLEEIIQQLLSWIDEDQKITPLKTLQGLIWEEGYQNGDYQGHIYPDAVEMLQKWRQNNISLYIYSSGSVYAQKLLFSYTEHGDLTPLFDGYFDTKIGAKIDSQSYMRISQYLNLPPEEILFLSDVEKELDAAKKAGMKTKWLVREGQLNPVANHDQVSNFLAINLQ